MEKEKKRENWKLNLQLQLTATSNEEDVGESDMSRDGVTDGDLGK